MSHNIYPYLYVRINSHSLFSFLLVVVSQQGMPTALTEMALIKHLDQSESAPTSFGVEGQDRSKMSDRLK